MPSSVDHIFRDFDRHGPAGDRRPEEGGIDTQPVAGDAGNPARDSLRHLLSQHQWRGLTEEAVEIPVARNNDTLAVKNPSSPAAWKVLTLQEARKTVRVERHRQHVENLLVAEDRHPDG